MVRRIKPTTLARQGETGQRLEEAVKKFREEMVLMPTGNPQIEYYAVFNQENPAYLMTVSQCNIKRTESGLYTVSFCVTSNSEERNKEVKGQFCNDTGIALDQPVPRDLQEFFEAVEEVFPDFIRDPEEAKAFILGY